MATGFWNNGKHIESNLAAQISALQSELKALRKQASRRGAESYEDARDSTAELIETLRENIASHGADVAKRARHAGGVMRDNVREHPGTAATAAAVGLVVVGLVATMLFSRSSDR